jgi:hypothetical protein
MAICTYCAQEMLSGASCAVKVLHHLGCDVPRLPDCGGRLFSCEFDEDEIDGNLLNSDARSAS